MPLQNLERSSQPVTPYGFLMQLRGKYPQFAQQRNGFYMQQDAEECWTQLLYSLRERLKVCACTCVHAWRHMHQVAWLIAAMHKQHPKLALIRPCQQQSSPHERLKVYVQKSPMRKVPANRCHQSCQHNDTQETSCCTKIGHRACHNQM